MGMWTVREGEVPETVANTPLAHHCLTNSPNVGCFFLLRNHRLPSPDFCGRSWVADDDDVTREGGK